MGGGRGAAEAGEPGGGVLRMSLPLISGAQCILAPTKFGYAQVRQKGSHVRLACPGRSPVTIPLHHELDRGTLRSILRTVDISEEQFKSLL